MKTASVFLACILALVHAATGLEKPPLPDGPLLARAPDSASWTISYTYDATTTPASSPQLPAPTPPARITEVVVLKTGTAYYRKEISDSGETLHQWCVEGVVLTGKNERGPFLFSDGNDSSIFGLSYRASDFPDLAWIAPDNFVGVEDVEGAKCLIFKKQIPRMKEALIGRLGAQSKKAALKDTVETTVWINLDTRLPVQETMPGQKLSYKFRTAPTATVALPLAAKQEMDAWRSQKALLDRPRPSP